METAVALYLVVLIVGMILFATERFSPDVTALGMMLALVVLGLLDAEAAFAGFGSPTVMMILGLLVMTEALIYTGLVDATGRYLLQMVKGDVGKMQWVLLGVPPLFSAFISNTASTAFFLPLVLSLSQRAKLSVSRQLMPLAFSSILAGSTTLIGTSTNLVISGLIVQYDMAPLSMFELSPVGIPILLVGLLYMGTLGRRLIPDRTGLPDESHALSADLYYTEIRITPQSMLVGKSIEASGLIDTLGLGMLVLQRGEERLNPRRESILEPYDVLLVEGTRANILRIETFPGVEISGKIRELEQFAAEGETRTIEVIVLPGSPLVGRNVQGLGFRDRYRAQILAVNQAGEIRHSKIGRLNFNVGDVLLIRVPASNQALLVREGGFRTLDIMESALPQHGKAPRALAIFAGSLAVAVAGLLPIAVAVLAGTVLMFATGCIHPEEAYRRVQWKTLILIGSMLALGKAMQDTGTADFLAQQIIALPSLEEPRLFLAVFFGMGVVLTQLLSNQAAAAVLAPIAIETAMLLDRDPRPAAIMIALAASTSFITPLEPSCMLIYSAGRYRFSDFVRVGGLLSVLVFLVAIVMVPLLWPM